MTFNEMVFSEQDTDAISIDDQKRIKKLFLESLGVATSAIPDAFFEPCIYYDKKGKTFSESKQMKVSLNMIKGSSYDIYAQKTWIETFAMLKRASRYIKNGDVTKKKYFTGLKKTIKNKHLAIRLIKAKDGFYYVDGNGNHRVTLYKMMYYSDITNGLDCSNDYWLYAMVKDEL